MSRRFDFRDVGREQLINQRRRSARGKALRGRESIAINLRRLGRRLSWIDWRNLGQPLIERIGVHIDGGA